MDMSARKPSVPSVMDMICARQIVVMPVATQHDAIGDLQTFQSARVTRGGERKVVIVSPVAVGEILRHFSKQSELVDRETIATIDEFDR